MYQELGRLTKFTCVVIISNMKAKSLFNRRVILSTDAFVELVVWQVPEPVKACTHLYKYRLAFICQGQCVLRYDNEAGKGDHKHIGKHELVYAFNDVDTLIADFLEDVRRWQNENSNA